jgi:hypothetical protein
MYWIFLVLFIVTVLIPDIVSSPIFGFSEERFEEIAIFLMGAVAFFVFIKNEQLLIFHRKEKEKDQRKIDQTVKDLVESYSYIGEVNRKMDIIMNIALGLSDRSVLDKKREAEIYDSIIKAANFLMKAECACLRFINSASGKTEKEIVTEGNKTCLASSVLTNFNDDIVMKKIEDWIIISSSQKISSIRSFLIIKRYDREEEKNQKNIEILKVFASQALFLYSYTHESRLVSNPPRYPTDQLNSTSDS